jgi:outer membrane protein assembly factor BamB
MTRNKTTTAIAILLILTFAITLVAIPNAKAADTMKTFAFIGATPNPVGVGQPTLLHIGITQQLANVALGWTGLTVTVTKPDGSTDPLGPFSTDSTGGTGYIYTPSMAGNYTFQTHFPEQLMPTAVGGIPANTTMLASDSGLVTLVVQQEPIQYYSPAPLPTEYWTRPINAQFREWYTISGSSFMDNEYNEAPDTPHILWTKALTMGGLVGGDMGLVGSGSTSVAMENGDAYEGKFATRLILNGRLYYTDGAYDRPRLVHCVDLRTGEEYWAKTFLNNQTIAFGQDYYWQSYNYQGTFAYLWVTVGSTWTAFDAFTGNWMGTITNVPSGTRITDAVGDVYVYTVDQTNGWMALWNMSALISMQGSWGSAFCLHQYDAKTGTVQTAAADGTLNPVSYTASANASAADRAARAWAWNITIPKGLKGSVTGVKLGDKVVGVDLVSSVIYRSSEIGVSAVNIWAFSLKSGQEGHLLYNTTWNAPADWANETITWVTTDLDANIGLASSKEACQHYAFSLEDGTYMWATPPEFYLSIYGIGRKIAYGNLYTYSMSGIVYCYDLTTGETKWSYALNDVGHEVLWSNNWPIDTDIFVSGGKLYFFQCEHSVNQPMPRDAPVLCLNATNGDVIWRVDGLFRTTHWGGSAVLGDSVIAMYSTYDQLVYAIGKGPSAMTVQAPLNGITVGDKLVIQGTVMDVSPGTKEAALTLRFPNGVPAVSDESTGEWMKYVYVHFPKPTNATGVPVSIDAIDPNNNYIHIGDATSDASGLFHFSWQTPDIPGDYTIIATFAGSGAYYGSSAETAAVVTEAPAATPAPTPSPTSMSEMYFLPMSVGLIIAIAVVIALLAMVLLRKHA